MLPGNGCWTCCCKAFVGGPIALINDGDSITIDAHERLIQLNVGQEELELRKAAWKKPTLKYKRGLLASTRG